MGSSASRPSRKGLSGRRSQSSGNLCHGTGLTSMSRIFSSCGGGGMSRRERHRFSGSLPDNLDEKEPKSGKESPESPYSSSTTTNGDVYYPTDSRNIEMLLQKISQVRPYGADYPLRDNPKFLEIDQAPRELAPPPPTTTTTSSPPMINYPFITEENTFEVRMFKTTRGLGLSITGGSDTAVKFPGLIRIKRIFDHDAAWSSHKLQINDIILEANGTPITGLSNNEAVEVLRTTPNNVILSVCRPPRDILSMPPPSVCTAPPPPPKRKDPAQVVTSSQLNATGCLLLPPLTAGSNEFEIVLRKIKGSLGFMLRKEDESVLGHCVRALVREPALSDGRIRPGDKIVMVNGVDITPLSHEEAVMYLRQCGNEVRLRLYRDPAQTPVSALSPTDSSKTSRPKPILRKEARDMLSDLAVKKKSPTESSSSGSRVRFKETSPSSSPRRRKPKRTPSDEKRERPGSIDPCKDTKRVSYLEMEREEDTDSIITVISTSDILRMGTGNAASVCPSSRDRQTEVCSQPSSMPPMSTSTSSSRFSHRNPVYKSAQAVVRSEPDLLEERVIPSRLYGDGGGPRGLLKWKGVILIPEDEEVPALNYPQTDLNYEVFTIELCRGWNSRLGIGLRSEGSATCVSTVYGDTVASRDGRLRNGDELIMINGESTEEMSTADVITYLRGVKGVIALTFRRKRIPDPPSKTEH